MGLAGESLVEVAVAPAVLQVALAVEALAGPTCRHGRRTRRGGRSRSESQERSAALLGDARARLAACRELLSDRMAEFDRRMRNTDDLSARLYREVISSRMRPFRDGVQGLPRLVRDLARQLGKKVQLEILGETTEVDRDILEKLDAPLESPRAQCAGPRPGNARANGRRRESRRSAGSASRPPTAPGCSPSPSPTMAAGSIWSGCEARSSSAGTPPPTWPRG